MTNDARAILLNIHITLCWLAECIGIIHKEKHFSCKKIRAFIDGHNARRLLLAEGRIPGQPAASEMRKLVWDEELHEKATKWANRNEGSPLHSHNPDKSVPSGKYSIGENLYSYSTTNLYYKLDPDSALQDWFSEHTNFTFGPLQYEHFMSGQIGHYTQMVWSDSIYVGCAISKILKQGWNNFFVVCDYGPQGNYVGQTPYKTGAGASNRLICDHRDCSRPYGNKC